METNSAFAESVTLIPVLKRRDRNITHLVQLFLAELQHENAAQPLLLDTLSTALSVYPLREYTTAKPEKVSPSGLSSSALNHVLDYIHAHLADDLSLSRLAQEAGQPMLFCQPVQAVHADHAASLCQSAAHRVGKAAA